MNKTYLSKASNSKLNRAIQDNLFDFFVIVIVLILWQSQG
jgi:hypothetical protein